MHETLPTKMQKDAIKKVLIEGKSPSKAMREVGYSKGTAKNPKNLTKSKAWRELMRKYLPDKDLAESHKQLLNATKIEHMVFPTSVKDKVIKELLESVNCKVRKIQHGDMANHCWFWARDNKALKDGLDLAYKLKGKYAPEKKKLISDGPIGLLLQSIHAKKEPLVGKEQNTNPLLNDNGGGIKDKDTKPRVETEQSVLDKKRSGRKGKI